MSIIDRYRTFTGDLSATIVGPFAVKPASADHWSGGDDLVKAAIERGEVQYWTIQGHKGMTLCDGRRFKSPKAAARWMAQEMERFGPVSPGRPPLAADAPTVKVEVKLPEDLRDDARAAAEAQGVTVSEWVRGLIRDALAGRA